MVISVRLCSGRTGFEVTTNIKIDLTRAAQILDPKVTTKHILLLNNNGVEVSMYPSGRMLVKTESKEKSLEIALDLLAKLGISLDKDQKSN